MNYDPYCLQEKIISDLLAVMKKDPHLEEFDIVPAMESKNRSPVIHISHNVGIEMWCVKSTFMYCYENCFKLDPVWKKEHTRLERYTRMALLLNGNISTFWNLRKRLISHHLLEADCDLLLTKLVLSQKPKTVEALAHRRWLIRFVDPTEERWIETELNLCNQLSNRIKCNYHAWSHRQWVYSRAAGNKFNLILWEAEFRLSEEWTKSHLSDHSGWHYRKFLMEQFKRQVNDNIDVPLLSGQPSLSAQQLYLNLLKEELEKNEDLILNFSGHETLWYYRRFILQGIFHFAPAQSSVGSESVFLDTCFHQNPSKNRIFMENHRRWLSSSSCLV